MQPRNFFASSGVINYFVRSFFVGAVSATVKRAVCFDAVAENFAAAVVAHGRELMNRTLEAVEHMGDTRRHDLKR